MKHRFLGKFFCLALLLPISGCKDEVPLVIAPVPPKIDPSLLPPPTPPVIPIVPPLAPPPAPGPAPAPAPAATTETAERPDPLLVSGRLVHALLLRGHDAGIPFLPGYTKATAYFTVPVSAVGERAFGPTGFDFNSKDATVVLPVLKAPDDKLDCRVGNVRRIGPADVHRVWQLAMDFAGNENDCRTLNTSLGFYGFRVDIKNLRLSPTDVRVRTELRVFPLVSSKEEWVAETWSPPIVPISAQASVSVNPIEIDNDASGATFAISLAEITSPIPITSLRWDDADDTRIAGGLNPCKIESVKVLPQYSGKTATMMVTTKGALTPECRSKIYGLTETGFSLTLKNIAVLVPSAAAPGALRPAKLDALSYLRVRAQPWPAVAFPARDAPAIGSFTVSNGKNFRGMLVRDCKRFTEADGSKRISFAFGTGKPKFDFEVKEVRTPRAGEPEMTYVSQNTEESGGPLFSPLLQLQTGELATKKNPADISEKDEALFYFSYPMGYVVPMRHCRVLFAVDAKNFARGRFDCLNMVRFDIHDKTNAVDASGTFRCELR